MTPPMPLNINSSWTNAAASRKAGNGGRHITRLCANVRKPSAQICRPRSGSGWHEAHRISGPDSESVGLRGATRSGATGAGNERDTFRVCAGEGTDQVRQSLEIEAEWQVHLGQQPSQHGWR